MVTVGTAVAYLLLDSSGFNSGIRTARQDFQNFMDSTNSASDRIGALGDGLSKTGNTLTKSVSLPLAGLGGVAIKTAADFEAAMSEVGAISGASGKDFEALKAKAKEMGATTKFSASEAAEAMKYMGMAGWDAGQMIDGVAGIMNLAAASGESLGTTSDIVTDALTAFGMSASEAGRFADVLARTATKSNTNVAMLGESFKYAAPVAGAMGYSVEDASIALGLMANSGIKASTAGTTLRSIITNMANPSDKMAAAMKELGVSLEDDEVTCCHLWRSCRDSERVSEKAL